jgi:hypothetical protein
MLIGDEGNDSTVLGSDVAAPLLLLLALLHVMLL